MQIERNENEGFWEESDVLKQGYLIKFQRGLVKAPKMRYFVLTQKALVAFASKPDKSTDYQPLGSLSLEHLTSLKIDEIELNDSTLSCIQITGRASCNFLVAFSRKEERDEWMMVMLKAYSERLISSRNLSHLEAKDTKTTMNVGLGDSVVTPVVHLQLGILTPSLRKRRKTNNGSSLRRSKSYDVDLQNLVQNCMDENSTTTTAVEDTTVCQFSTSRKRKSEPDIHVLCNLPDAWNLECPDKEFRNNCFDHRDSLTLLPAKKQDNKVDAKNSIVSKIISTFTEHSTRHIH